MNGIENGMSSSPSLIDRLIRFCLERKLVVALLLVFVVLWGVVVAPFDWDVSWFHRRPVAVDAIPNIGENQQIVHTEWMGRSPRDADDQIAYPLTISLLGMPGVKTVRSYSSFGFSTVYVIFDEGVSFEASQNRILARLNGLPSGLLPEGVKPALGPYATALGQIFWYTIEGRDPDGKPIGGWDLHELRAVQDWMVRYHLQAVEGVAEVASVGGFVQEYQVDVDPDALRAHGVTIEDVFAAVRSSNADSGARQIEFNRVEYLVRARGFLRSVADVENTAVKVVDNVPILVRDVARVALGPAMREGALDKEGAEVVGGVVVVTDGFNPLKAIQNVKERIRQIESSLPVHVVVDHSKISRAQVEKIASTAGFSAYAGSDLNHERWATYLSAMPRDRWPSGMTTSRLSIQKFYDRTDLIHETLGTLNDALYQQVLITTIVVIVMAMHMRSSILISAVMPLAVLITFITMKLSGVDANIVSLSGIAIAIGTIVDMGIVITDNIRQHLDRAEPGADTLEVIYRASSEVGSSIFTAIATTVVGFMPVFFMTGPEGKLFRPLAFTKTFCLLASVVVALTIIPSAAQLLFTTRGLGRNARRFLQVVLVTGGIALIVWMHWVIAGGALILAAVTWEVVDRLEGRTRKRAFAVVNALILVLVAGLLTEDWMPLGLGRSFTLNMLFVVVLIGGFQLFYFAVERFYEPIMRFFLAHKAVFFSIPAVIIGLGYTAWLGFDSIFGAVPRAAEKAGINARFVRQNAAWSALTHTFPGFGREFMPPLDEGSFLYMPTTMPHASIGEAMDIVRKQDMAIRGIPEVASVVGKVGRADSALDPAPMNMVETVINYRSEFVTDEHGRVMRFRYDEAGGDFVRKDGALVPDPSGRPYRQWRDHIRTPDDIWKEIVAAADVPGSTSAPKLQPIAARLVMLQSGMRAPMGVKVKGPSPESIERGGVAIERLLKEVPGVEPSAVVADRIVGKPYLEIDLKRDAMARYGMSVAGVQDAIEVAIGGKTLTSTVEGRARFPVRVRYMRELRDRIESLGTVLMTGADGVQVPLSQLAEIRYVRGPEVIKSEDGFLVGYVLFDKQPAYAEVDVVEACDGYLKGKVASQELQLPKGVTYEFAGNYQNQLHAQKTLSLILPLTLFVIFLLIYFQFRSVVTTSLVFSTVFVCWGGGLVLIWLYGQPWFLDVHVFGIDLRDLFQVHTVSMSVAIWVGFLALFGIATDDGVLVCTYLDQRFREVKPATIVEVREATVYAGKRRVRACLMTTATTVLALLPVLTSRGRGSDIMMPMSLPSFGGMLAEVFVMFVAAILYSWVHERRIRRATLPRRLN